MSKKVSSTLLLLLTAIIWGSAFSAQTMAVESIGPFTVNATRFFIGGLFLIPVILVLDRKKPEEEKKLNPTLIKGGVLCGLVLGIASSLQQIGLKEGVSAGKAGFITTLYMVIVPIISIFLGKKLSFRIWTSVVIATAGLVCLSLNESLSVQTRDIYVMLCAVAFAVHILVIDKFSSSVDCVKMSCIQFFVAGVCCAVPMLVFETSDFSGFSSAILPILYVGIFSSGVAYTLQIVSQKNLDPTVASIIMSLESVFSAIFGFIILNQVMSLKEIIGCILVFAAITILQLPEKKQKCKTECNL